MRFVLGLFIFLSMITVANAQQHGYASYYSKPQRVASGGVYNPNAYTAAHKTLAFGTRVLVTNKLNGKSVTVTINDRGPFVRGRVIDLSLVAAKQIAMTKAGVVPVIVEVQSGRSKPTKLKSNKSNRSRK